MEGRAHCSLFGVVLHPKTIRKVQCKIKRKVYEGFEQVKVFKRFRIRSASQAPILSTVEKALAVPDLGSQIPQSSDCTRHLTSIATYDQQQMKARLQGLKLGA